MEGGASWQGFKQRQLTCIVCSAWCHLPAIWAHADFSVCSGACCEDEQSLAALDTQPDTFVSLARLTSLVHVPARDTDPHRYTA